jgi:glycosyltransferase involved in cell wall biosynthesis
LVPAFRDVMIGRVMRIILVTSLTPWVEGGSTQIVSWLHRKLVDSGHEVELFEFPISETYPQLLDQALAFRLIDLGNHGDRMIAIRTPSHLLRHPNKVAWFIHHYRSAYDLWGTHYQTIPETPEGVAYRRAIVRADDVGLNECRRVFCNSAVVRDRLRRYNKIAAQILYPPLLDPSRFRCGAYGDYILYFARLTHHKRQWLAIEALRHTNTPVRLVIAGAPDPGVQPYLYDLRRLVEKYNLQDRVSIISRWVSDEDKCELFADCAAVAYFPFDEDSYGYPSLEAHAARKAVITTVDSGGTIELVIHGENGFVTPSDPELIAVQFDRLYRDRSLAKRMGEAGVERIRKMGINWENVITPLLG